MIIITIFDPLKESIRETLDPVTFLNRFIKLNTADGVIAWKDTMDSYQMKILRDMNRFTIINKSKKTGISTTISGKALHKAFFNPNIDQVIVATGERIASEILSKIGSLIESMPTRMQLQYKQNVERIELKNNARLVSLPSYKPANIRGYGLKGKTDIYIDEFAHVNNDAELWSVARDFMILGGNATLISTPMGKRGKFHEISYPLQAVYRKELPYSDNIWSYHEIPYTRCPRLVAQERVLRSDVDEIHFKQEYMCEFIDEAVSFFPYGLIMPCVEAFEMNKRELYPNGFKTENIVYVGIDLAEKINETAVIVVEKINQRFIVRHHITMPGADYATEQIPYFVTVNANFNPLSIKIDEGGPGEGVVSEMEKLLPGRVWGEYLTGQMKERLIVRLRMLMEAKLLELPRDMKLIDQIHSVERTTTQSGMHSRYSGKKPGQDDDMVWALALAIYEEVEIDDEPYLDTLPDKTMLPFTNQPSWGETLQKHIAEHKDMYNEEVIVLT